VQCAHRRSLLQIGSAAGSSRRVVARWASIASGGIVENWKSGGNDDSDGGSYYDKKGFLRYVFIYIGVMLAQGAVSTLYSAIFTLVSRRLKFTIRNALLEKILAQDVAYFDGTESGQLISRLTNDLDMMMSPIQSSLSSLLSNCLVLVGGLVMCFAKSYRLSMLAFVTIGPISYLWEEYAVWSKKLAREMLSYWAQGNSVAAQALSHIRTVKAFGCEDVVLKKYSETNQMALNCGIKDAWGNGITSALTGYLDLGTGVLILYFGGLLVYRGEMTVGDLVTYQLFWNMMNNSYSNLQGLVTSFTRSAAGAKRSNNWEFTATSRVQPCNAPTTPVSHAAWMTSASMAAMGSSRIASEAPCKTP